MKLTTKTTKEQLIKFIGVNVSAIKKKDKDLYDEIAYADKVMKKDPKKVTRVDLMNMAKSVIKLLGDSAKDPYTVVAETSIKKAPKKDQVVEVEVPKKDTKTEEKPKKKLAKKSTKKTPPKETVKAKDNLLSQKVSVQLAETFPEVLHTADTTYKMARDIKTIDDLVSAYEKDENVILAFYWSQRHLRQYDYFERLMGQPKSFENDLDLVSCIYVSSSVSYFVSSETEAMYMVMPDNFAEYEGVRMSGGIEYQIYRAVEGDTEE